MDSRSTHLRLLGAAEITVRGQPVRLRSRRSFAVVGYLAVGGRRLERTALGETFWPDAAPSVARGNLRVLLSGVRTGAPGLLDIRRDSVGLDDSGELTVDVVELRTSLATASDPSLDASERIDHARRAVQSYGGDLLPGFESIDAPAFRSWLDAEREALRHDAVRAASLLVDLLLAAERHAEATSAALRLIALDEYREESYVSAMRAMAAAGEPQRALAQYERARAAIVDDLGLPLGDEFDTLVAGLRARSMPAAERRPVVGRMTSLPLRSHVIGRDGLLAELTDAARREGEHVVTLIGPAGVGKTTVAVALAHRWHKDGDDVVYVDASPVVDPAALPRAIEAAFRGGRADDGEKDGEKLDDVDALAAYIGERSVRLVVDNLEQLPGAGPVIHRLVARCPGAFVLATSRLPLGIAGERLVPVPPLDLPTDDDLAAIAASGAVAVFRHYALIGGAAPLDGPDELHAVARICHLLDGLPLAIQLAASRKRFTTARALATALEDDLRRGSYSTLDDDAPDTVAAGTGRRPGLHASLSSSVALLDPTTRRCFEDAAVFDGPFLADDLLALADRAAPADGDARATVERALRVLSDLHLVRLEHADDTVWVRMLPTVRALATASLSTAGRLEVVRARRIDHDVALVAAADREVSSLRGRDWFVRFDRYGPTMRATIDQLQATGDNRTLGVVTQLAPYWFDRGLVAEASRRLVAARSTIGPDLPSWLVPMNRLWAVLMRAEAIGYSTVADAVADAQDALAAVRAAGPGPRRELQAMLIARHVYDMSGRPDLARRLVEEGLRLADDTGHAWEGIEFLYAGVVLDHLDGDDERVRSGLVRVAAEAELLGHRRIVLYTRMLMTQYGLDGPEGGTPASLSELLDLAVEIGDRRQVVWLTASLAAVTAFGGDLRRGAALTFDALSISRDADYFLGIGLSLMCAAAIAVIDGRPDLAATFHEVVEPDLGPISRAIPRSYVELYLSVVEQLDRPASGARAADRPPVASIRSATASAAAAYLATIRDRSA